MRLTAFSCSTNLRTLPTFLLSCRGRYRRVKPRLNASDQTFSSKICLEEYVLLLSHPRPSQLCILMVFHFWSRKNISTQSHNVLPGADPGGWIGWLATSPFWGRLSLKTKKGNKTISEAILSPNVPISFCLVSNAHPPPPLKILDPPLILPTRVQTSPISFASKLYFAFWTNVRSFSHPASKACTSKKWLTSALNLSGNT